jgi:hypothetical protein
LALNLLLPPFASLSREQKFDELVRERDILTKLRSQAEGATQKQIDLIKINDNTKRNLEQEIQVRSRGSWKKEGRGGQEA